MNPGRILVVKLADLGDTLTATPALRALRRAHPKAHITALVTPNGQRVLEGFQLVDEVITFPKARFDRIGEAFSPHSVAIGFDLARRLRQGHFDAVALLHHLTTRWGAAKYAALVWATGAPFRAGLDNGLGRAGFLTHRATDLGFGIRHEVEYCEDVMRLLSAEPGHDPLEFPLAESDRAFAREMVPQDGLRIAVHPGSGSFSTARRWPSERFNAVVRSLARADGARIVLVGGPDEEEAATLVTAGVEPEPINLAGQTTVGQLAAVLERCDLFLGNDSGVMHLATAVGTPVVAVFGPTNHRAWGPWTGRGREDRATVVRAEVSGSPCLYVGFELGDPAGCLGRECLMRVTTDEVLLAVHKMLARQAVMRNEQ